MKNHFFNLIFVLIVNVAIVGTCIAQSQKLIVVQNSSPQLEKGWVRIMVADNNNQLPLLTSPSVPKKTLDIDIQTRSKNTDDSEKPNESEILLYPGDQCQIIFTPGTEKTYVYIFQKGSSGNLYHLFPTNDSNGLTINRFNPDLSDTTYFIPAQDKSFRLEKQIGEEDGSNRLQFLIPELPSKEEPDINWDYANSLAFQYHYDVLPDNIMSRFIVRMQEFISKNIYWHSGVVLARKDNKALVKLDTENKKMFIWINGNPATRREFLTAIREQFEYLHQSIPKINTTEQVPYKTVVIPYQDLLNAEKKGDKVFLIASLKEQVLISELLDGNEIPVKEEPIKKTAPPEPEVKKDNEDKIIQVLGLIMATIGAIAAVLALF